MILTAARQSSSKCGKDEQEGKGDKEAAWTDHNFNEAADEIQNDQSIAMRALSLHNKAEKQRKGSVAQDDKVSAEPRKVSSVLQVMVRRAAQANQDYNEIVEEIMREHPGMGSLQVHSEAMRRLKQRQQRQDQQPRRVSTVLNAIVRRASNESDDHQVSGVDQSPSIQAKESVSVTGFPGTIYQESRRESAGSTDQDSSRKVMLGRKKSTVVHHESFTVPMPTDIELSDDEWEDDDEPIQEEQEGVRDSRDRPHLVRRSSSRFVRSSRRVVRKYSRRFSSFRGAIEDLEDALAMPDDDPDLAVVEAVMNEDSNAPPNENARETGSKLLHPHARTGRRRSSLLSASGRATSARFARQRSRSSVGGIDQSITERSLEGSFAREQDDDESLICSVINSFTSQAAGNSLILGWDGRGSKLDASMVSKLDASIISKLDASVSSIQDEVLKGTATDGDLICGWDPRRSKSEMSALSVSECDRSLICDWNKSASQEAGGIWAWGRAMRR